MQVEVCRGSVYRFGLYEADVARSTLSRNGTPLKIQAQPFRVLIYLLKHSGGLVGRDELRHLLWGDKTYVDYDASLNVVFKKLRATLRDDAENPRFIETVPRRGYRFIAPVTVVGGNGEASRENDCVRGGQQLVDAERTAKAGNQQATNDTAGRRVFLRVVEFAMVAAIAVSVSFVSFNRTAAAISPETITRSYILAPQNTSFASSDLALSPDGRMLAFVAGGPNAGPPVLWIQALNSGSARPLTGTDGATQPFWSPDAQHIGFFAKGKLRRVDTEGGPPQALCDAPIGRGGTWNHDGVILFAPNVSGPLQQILAVGGVPTIALQVDAQPGEFQAYWPQFLPDGKRFIYWSHALNSTEVDGIYLGKMGSNERRLLVPTESGGLTADRNLLYVRDQKLLARRFDPRYLRLEGDPAPVADGIAIHGGMHYANFTASLNGLLAYFAGRVNRGWPMIMFDRRGKPEGRIYPQRDLFLNPRFSPNGKKLAVSIVRSDSSLDDLWVIDLSVGTRKRLTFESGDASHAVWSSDGKRIYYALSQEHGGPAHIYARLATGAGSEETVLATAGLSEVPMDISPHGGVLVYQRQETEKNWTIWMLPLGPRSKPFPFLQSSHFNATNPTFSPNGKLVAYMSDETGRFEIYIAGFAGGGRWQVSIGGGTGPAWSPDGKRLYFADTAESIMYAGVRQIGGAIEVSKPVALIAKATFAMPRPIAIAPDGRILVDGHNDEPRSSPSVTLVTNWPLVELNR